MALCFVTPSKIKAVLAAKLQSFNESTCLLKIIFLQPETNFGCCTASFQFSFQTLCC